MKYIFIFLLNLVFYSAIAQTEAEIYKDAKKYYSQENYKESIKLYSKLITINNKSENYYIGRADCHFALKNYQLAYNDYNKAVEINTFNPYPYLARGAFLYSINKPDEAIENYTMAKNYTSNDTIKKVAYLNRGSAKQNKRDFRGAYEDLTEAYKIDTNDTFVINNLATVLDELGRNEEAVAYLKRLIKNSPDFLGGYINMGFQLSKGGRYEEAIQYFNEGIKIDPKDPYILNNRGYAKYKLKDYSGALKDINKSLELYPGNSYAYRNRALVFIDQKNINKACADLQKALDMAYTQMYGDDVAELQKKHCNTK